MKLRVVLLGCMMATAILAVWPGWFNVCQPEAAAQTPKEADKRPDPIPTERIFELGMEEVPKVPSPKATGSAAAGANADKTSSTCSQKLEPAISLEWVGPQSVSANRTEVFQIVVKNLGLNAAENVVVRNRLPAGVKMVAAEPQPGKEGNLLTWELGTLQPRQEKRMELQLTPEGKGDFACQASVTFTCSSVARFQVREPKLSVKLSAPDKVLAGTSATLNLLVTNSGDGIARHVRLKMLLPEGLHHVRGKTIDFDLGTLAPQETRHVQVVCTTKVAGEHECEAVVTGEGNLKANHTAIVSAVLPRLDLVVTGPKLRYVERPAVYSIKVTNPGPAPANDIKITEIIPIGFKFLSATDGGRHNEEARTVSWVIGDMPPGQSREVKLEVMAAIPGEHLHRVIAESGHGTKTEAEAATRIEGLSALVMELANPINPVEVGVETCYEIRVTNAGSKAESNLRLICTLPDKMEFRSGEGPDNCRCHVEGREIVFDALPKLAPRADAMYRISVRSLVPGDYRFRASLQAEGLAAPLRREESTKVYSDEVR